MYTKPALESHLINHPSCRFCDLPFYDEEELEEHLVDEHDYCSICDEDVIDTDALAEHLRQETHQAVPTALSTVSLRDLHILICCT